MNNMHFLQEIERFHVEIVACADEALRDRTERLSPEGIGVAD